MIVPTFNSILENPISLNINKHKLVYLDKRNKALRNKAIL